MYLGHGQKNVTLQLAPSVGRACALASATANHGGIKLLPVGVHQEDRCGGGTSYTKASPFFPKTHRQLPLRSTLRSVDYTGRVAKRSVALGASNVRCVPRALDKRLILAGLVVQSAESPPEKEAEGQTRIF